MEDENNYRGTGRSKAELEADVSFLIDLFKQEHPGQPVPESLVHWVDNIADDEDVRVGEVRSRRRVLGDIMRYGDHLDHDGPMVEILMKEGLVEDNAYEDYVGYKLTDKGERYLILGPR